ncbi:unnamed protein product [Adineta steineri]|uniref:Uncharacterized protein n=1 Tax=Adineta steineri TaxID=433720 RepID=A0A815AKL2_9BILA|nr:unnamed protein product [Adineta steineri]CAF4122058.1 unnamed protein product [Adineta steineri]
MDPSKIALESDTNDTTEPELTQSTRLSICIRKKFMCIIICILIILIIAISIIILKMKKVNDLETSTITTAEASNMSIADTSIILSMPKLAQSCNIIKCRAIIAYYYLEEEEFDTAEFNDCEHCPSMSDRGMSDDWLNIWYEDDFFIANFIGQDCEGNPVIGNKYHCIQECFRDITCAGFTKNKNITDHDQSGECWLKNNITTNQIFNNSEWHTFVINTKSKQLYLNNTHNSIENNQNNIVWLFFFLLFNLLLFLPKK